MVHILAPLRLCDWNSVYH